MSVQSVWCAACEKSLGLMVTSNDLWLLQNVSHRGHRLWVGQPGVEARPIVDESSTEERPQPTLDEPYPVGGQSYRMMSMPERLHQTEYWTSKGRNMTLYQMGPTHLMRAMRWLEDHAHDMHEQWYTHIHVASWMLEQRAFATGREFMGLEEVVLEISEMDPKEWIRATPLYRAMAHVKEDMEVYFAEREAQRRDQEQEAVLHLSEVD